MFIDFFLYARLNICCFCCVLSDWVLYLFFNLLAYYKKLQGSLTIKWDTDTTNKIVCNLSSDKIGFGPQSGFHNNSVSLKAPPVSFVCFCCKSLIGNVYQYRFANTLLYNYPNRCLLFLLLTKQAYTQSEVCSCSLCSELYVFIILISIWKHSWSYYLALISATIWL